MAFPATPNFEYSIGSTTGGNVDSIPLDTTGLRLLVLGAHGYADGASVPVLQDNKSNPWIPLPVYRTSGASQVQLFYLINPGAGVGPGHILTIATSATAIYPTMTLLGWYEEGTFADENGASTGSNVTSLDSGIATPIDDGSLVISAYTCGAAVTDLAVAGGGLTIKEDVAFDLNKHMRGVIACEVQGTAAARSANWTWNTATPAAAAIAVFTPPPAVDQRISWLGGTHVARARVQRYQAIPSGLIPPGYAE